MIRSGEIAAAIEMRDDVLVEAQRQLDELAAGMARALSDKPALVTAAGTGFDIDVTGMQPGDTINLEYKDSGGVSRRITLVATNGGAPSPFPPSAIGDPGATVIPFDLSAGLDAVVTEITTALSARGIGISHPSGNLLRLSDGTSDVTALSGAITMTGLSNADGDPHLPFFIDGGTGAPFSGSFEGGPALTGFAQRITVNPDLVDDPSALVKIAAATPQGDTERPQFLLDSLTKTNRTFSGAAGLSGSTPVTTSVAEFARRVVETQAANAEHASRLDEGQSVALAAIESRFSETSAVNIDQEMAQLVTLQMAYGANARVMTAVRDMMDMLMRM
jgi:flagellar hook-associated protein 1 FlgK